MKLLIIFFAMLLSFCSHAEWYEAIGQAEIKNGEKDIARNKATQEAIKQALIVAGGSISAVQQTSNGLLTDEFIEVESGGDIHEIKLVSEVVSGDMITVTVRAYIIPQQNKCFAADYKKSLALVQFGMVDRHQAAVGNIYNIGSQIPERMQNYLVKFGNYTQVNTIIDRKTTFSPQLINYPEKLIDLITITADTTDAQFILFGMVNDVSMGNTESNNFQFWKNSKTERFFEIELFLYSGINGELIFNERYSTRAEWDFDVRERVDIRSRRFWESKYGLALLENIANASGDIDEYLKCLPSRARVISVNDNTVQFNLGAQNGVKVGDTLNLMHLANFKDESGRLRSKFNISPFTVEVTDVYRSSAVAKSVDDMQLSNVQPNDLVVRQ